MHPGISLEQLTGLTAIQQQAIMHLQKIQEGRRFVGISAHTVATDFRSANVLRQTDSARAEEWEKDLLSQCGYDPSNT